MNLLTIDFKIFYEDFGHYNLLSNTLISICVCSAIRLKYLSVCKYMDMYHCKTVNIRKITDKMEIDKKKLLCQEAESARLLRLTFHLKHMNLALRRPTYKASKRKFKIHKIKIEMKIELKCGLKQKFQHYNRPHFSSITCTFAFTRPTIK